MDQNSTKWLIAELKRTGETQRAVAKALGIDVTAMNKIVKGTRRISADELTKAQRFFASRGPRGSHIGNSPDLPDPESERITVDIPEYDVRASMGDGFTVDRETIKDMWTFSRRYLSDEMRLNLQNLVVIEVIGDSMKPTLESGDRVLVDMGDRRVGIPGIFVLWDGDGTVAKRLELVPNSKPQKINRISDNPLHDRYEVLAADTNIVGRIVWFARRL